MRQTETGQAVWWHGSRQSIKFTVTVIKANRVCCAVRERMTKKPATYPVKRRPIPSLGPNDEAEEYASFDREVSRLLQRVGFEVTFRGGGDPDMVATRLDRGIPKRYWVDVFYNLKQENVSRFVERCSMAKDELGEDDDYIEYWLVGKYLAADFPKKKRGLRYDLLDAPIRLLDFNGLTKLLVEEEALSTQRSPVKQRAHGKIGKAIVANQSAISLAVAALLLQIEDKITSLRSERPNSPQAIERRDAALFEFERMRAELENIRLLAARFTKNEVSEKKVVSAVTTFAEGIRSWWNKSHERICDKAYDMGMFATAVTICSLTGAAGNVGVAVSAALVGGKPVAEAIRGIGKRLLGG